MEWLVIMPTEHLMLQDREGNCTLCVRMYIDTVADNMTPLVILLLGIILMNTQTQSNVVKYFHYNSTTKIRMSLDEFYVST